MCSEQKVVILMFYRKRVTWKRKISPILWLPTSLTLPPTSPPPPPPPSLPPFLHASPTELHTEIYFSASSSGNKVLGILDAKLELRNPDAGHAHHLKFHK